MSRPQGHWEAAAFRVRGAAVFIKRIAFTKAREHAIRLSRDKMNTLHESKLLRAVWQGQGFNPNSFAIADLLGNSGHEQGA